MCLPKMLVYTPLKRGGGSFDGSVPVAVLDPQEVNSRL